MAKLSKQDAYNEPGERATASEAIDGTTNGLLQKGRESFEHTGLSSETTSSANDHSPLGSVVCILTSFVCRIISAILFIGSIGGYCYMTFSLQPGVIKEIHNRLLIRPNTSYNWESPKGSILIGLRFFNVSNPQAGVNRGEKFRLQEMGPYIYRIISEKIDVVWNANSTVSYRENNIFRFEPQLSNGTEQDIVTTIDFPFLAIADEPQSGMMQSWVTGYIQSGDELFTTRTVKEFLWGYQNNALAKLDTLKSLDVFGLFTKVQEIPSNFGFLLTANATPTPVFNVHTGVEDFTKLNDVHSYDYQTFVEGKKVHGSAAGSMYPPPVHSDSDLAVFFGPLFRPLDLEYIKTTAYNGLKSFRFEVPESQFSLRTNDLNLLSQTTTSTPLPSTIAKTETSSQLTVSNSLESPKKSTAMFTKSTTSTARPEATDLSSSTTRVITPKTSTARSENTGLFSHKTTTISSPSKSTKLTFDDKSETISTVKTKLSDMSSEQLGVNGQPDGNCGDQTKQESATRCIKGIASMEPLSKGAPMFASFPHFLGADAETYQRIDGLDPDEHKHRSFVDVHPYSGVSTQLYLRYQLNGRLNLTKLNRNGNDNSIVYLPMIWIEAMASMDETSVEELKQLDDALELIDCVTLASFCCLCVTAALVVVLIVTSFVKISRHGQRRYTVPSEDC